AVELTDKTRIEVNRSVLSLDAAKTLFAAGRKITLTFTEDQAIVVRFAYSHTGTLTELNTTGKRIVVKIDDTSTVTIPYDTPAVQIYGQTSASLSDLKISDKVTVQLDQNLDKALIVKVHKVVQMQVASTDAV